MLPTSIFALWFSALWSFGIIGGGVYLIYEWWRRSWFWDVRFNDWRFDPAFGGNAPTAMLALGALLLLWSVAGGFTMRAILRLLSRSEPADRVDDAANPRPSGKARRVRREDGGEIQIEEYGPTDGSPVVLTHGWQTNRRAWDYLRRDGEGRGFRFITWDLPGLGDSDRPRNNDYSMETFARDLDLVLTETCGDKPAVLVGHSIGGMILLTFCRLFPEKLGSQVKGLALITTTYTDPVRTAKGGAIYTLLEGPVIKPLLYLTIALSPVLWVSTWFSYANGSAHLQTRRDSFAGTQSWEQLEVATRFSLPASPAVIAHGMLAMMRYNATETLKTVSVPTLIIAAEGDGSCPPSASERMARDIPDARMEILSPANHMIIMEQRHRFAQILADFVHSCLGDAGAVRPLITTVRKAQEAR